VQNIFGQNIGFGNKGPSIRPLKQEKVNNSIPLPHQEQYFSDKNYYANTENQSSSYQDSDFQQNINRSEDYQSQHKNSAAFDLSTLTDEQIENIEENLSVQIEALRKIKIERKFKDWIPPILESLQSLDDTPGCIILIQMNENGMELFEPLNGEAGGSGFFKGVISGRLLELAPPKEQ